MKHYHNFEEYEEDFYPLRVKERKKEKESKSKEATQGKRISRLSSDNRKKIKELISEECA